MWPTVILWQACPNSHSCTDTGIAVCLIPFNTFCIWKCVPLGPVLHHVRAAILWGNSLDTSASKKPQNAHIRFTTKVPDEPWAHLVAVQSEVDDIMGLQAAAASTGGTKSSSPSSFRTNFLISFCNSCNLACSAPKKLKWLWVLGIIYSNHVLWPWKHYKARICAWCITIGHSSSSFSALSSVGLDA